MLYGSMSLVSPPPPLPSSLYLFHKLMENQSTKSESKLKIEEIQKSQWNFNLSAVVSSSIGGGVSDTLGVIEFDPLDNLIATAGIARKIRVYEFSSLLPEESSESGGGRGISLLEHNNVCDYCICTPAKLSSLRWKPNSGSRVLASGDYDGVVMEYDLERKVPIFERDEHGGRRIWSVDYSDSDPVIGASGSDDGTMQIWDPRSDGGECVVKVQPSVSRSSVCCVEFNPFDGVFIAVGCADRNVYGYDIRRADNPVSVFRGHSKTVTYVKFLDVHSMVSAGTDGCLKLWNIDNSRVIRSYEGHVNSRRFVGLSVWRNGGLIGCGSENNRVFVYDKSWSEPIWVHEFDPAGCENGFVGSVCWRQMVEDRCTLVAGGSDGVLQVYTGKSRTSSF